MQLVWQVDARCAHAVQRASQHAAHPERQRCRLVVRAVSRLKQQKMSSLTYGCSLAATELVVSHSSPFEIRPATDKI
jgi:hypothetical protein